MRPGVAEDGPPTGERDVREVGDGDTISAPVVRDFLLTCLRHDALHDVVMERLDILAREGGLDISRVAEVLPELHAELLRVVRSPDWIYAAGALMDAYSDAAGEGEGG
jgi:hypothetical protein